MLKRLTVLGIFALTPFVANAAAPPPAPAPPSPPGHTMHWSFEIGQGRLGAQVSSMTSELRAFFGAPADSGILVQRVEKDSVAHHAGVAVGDVIVEIDGDPVDSSHDVMKALADRKSGESVDVVVVRKHKRRTLAARMQDDPIQFPSGFGAPLGPGFGSSLGPGFDFDLRGFGAPPELEEKLRELEQRLQSLEGSGGSPPRRAPKRKAAPKRPAQGV